MTTTFQRPTGSSPTPQNPGRRNPGSSTGASGSARSAGSSQGPLLTSDLVSSELLATMALTVFSIMVAVGYARVFSGWAFLDECVVLAVVGHGFGYLTRRLGVPGLVAVPALAVVLAWLIGLVHYGDSYTLFLPTGDTIELFRAELERVQGEFRTAVAPVIYDGGWDVLAAIGLGLTVLLSDTFAFRAFARAESLVPGGVLFVFVAALGSDRDRVASTAGLIAAGVVATVALRSHHGPERGAAIGARRSPARLVIPAAIGTAVVVALAAAFVGPRLPGADSAPVYETRGGNGGSVTNVVSPLVEIRSRLTNQGNAELFTVAADFESYWRLSALPRFNGNEWGLPERALSRVEGELSPGRAGAVELRQTITIADLGDQFVPSAADVQAASPQEDLRFNADSSTLLKIDGPLATGETYEIVSASPRFDVAALQAASSTDAGDDIYLELPDDFPSIVGETARQATAGAATPYETALTLQNWFRDNFEYSLEVQSGHGTTAIEGFLRDRIGYCEQFAGTYAAMMRTLGVPARVAVGFTPGNFNGERYSVLGKNAHAWPEVWFDGLGWVPFEPTPGRGAPGSENYTNVAAQQDATAADPDSGAGDAAGTPAVPVAPPTTVAPTPVTNPDGSPSGPDVAEVPATPIAPTDTSATERSAVPIGVLLAIAVIALLIASPALVRRVRRRRLPADRRAAVAALWRRSVADLRELGIPERPSATPLEQARSAASVFPVIARPFGSLAATMTEVSYGPVDHDRRPLGPEGDARFDECRQWARQIERAVNDSITPLARLRRHFTRWS